MYVDVSRRRRCRNHRAGEPSLQQLGDIMKLRYLTFIALAPLGTASPVHAQIAQTTELLVATDVEEIYIARSVRQARTPPTEFCAKARTGVSSATIEDQYSFRSVATDTSNGRLVDTNVKTVGSIHACFGPTANPAILEFYGETLFGATAFKGLGECHLKPDFPDKGLTFARCFLELSGLPAEYVGGQLTTNSMSSLKILGTETEPGGYTQSSIATIRLWKKRIGR
jgi:hypothetical protein